MSIQRRNKVNWHYVRDDHMFSTIKLVSRHQNMQQFGALLLIELTNKEIRNSNAYKEYYAIATGAAPPKPKASARRTRSSSDTSITPSTATASPRLTASTKDEGTSSIPGVPDAPTDESEEELSWNSTDDEGADDEGKDGDDDEVDEVDDGKEGDGDDDEDDDGEEGNDDDDDQEFKRDDDKDDEKEGGMMMKNMMTNMLKKIGMRRVLILSLKPLKIVMMKAMQSSSVSSQFVISMLNPTLDVGMESIFETTLQLDVQTPTSVAPLPISAPTMTPSTIATITTTSQAPILPTTVPSTIIQNLSNFGSLFHFDDRLRQLKWPEFLKIVDENMKKIIKEQVKEQVKVQVSNILPRIEQAVNEQLEAEFLTRSSHSSKIYYVVAADLSEMGLKKILIEKIEGNKDDEMMMLIRMKNPLLDQTRGQTDAEKERSLKEPMQTTSQMEEPSHLEFDTGAEDQPIVQSSQYPEWFSLQQKPPSLDRDWNKTVPAVYESIQPWISELAKQADTRSSFIELMDTPLDFFNFIMNRLKVDTLTPELLAGPTYELMKGSCKSLVELEYHLEEVFKTTTDQLDWVNPEGQQYPHNLLKPLPLIPSYQGRHVIPFEHFINNDLEYLRGGASSQERDISESHSNSSTPPDPSISFLTEKVLKFNSLFESLRLVPPSPNLELVCTKEEDGDVMFIHIIPKYDDSRKDEPEVEGATMEEPVVDYFDTFPTRDKLT
nr:hypothetical protein [Tanacetum cinerariifolium]